jgi:hypothetical protein
MKDLANKFCQVSDFLNHPLFLAVHTDGIVLQIQLDDCCADFVHQAKYRRGGATGCIGAVQDDDIRPKRFDLRERLIHIVPAPHDFQLCLLAEQVLNAQVK